MLRSKLLERVLEKLGNGLAQKIALMRKTNEVVTIGDESGVTQKMSRSVTQRSPLSSFLFNLYIDSFIEGAKDLVITSGSP